MAAKFKDYDVTIESIKQEVPEVNTYRLKLPDDHELDFVMGQFVQLNMPSNPKLRRSYSIASSPQELIDHGWIELTIRRVEEGRFTPVLFSEAEEGGVAHIRGPFGHWVYDDDIDHAVLISGGTGIAPFRGFARHVIGRELKGELTVMYSSRTPSDIIYFDEWQELGKHEKVNTYLTVTRPHEMAEGETWDGPTGRINIDVIKEKITGWKDCVYYLCGPNALVDTFREGLKEEGLEKTQIRYEKWGDF